MKHRIPVRIPVRRHIREAYNPLFKKGNQFEEAFKSGSNQKVIQLMSNIIGRKSDINMSPVPNGYRNSNGDRFVSYVGMGSKMLLHVNFLLGDSDYIHSVSLVSKSTLQPYETYTFDKETNIVTVMNTIIDIIQGKYNEKDYIDPDELMEESFQLDERRTTKDKRFDVFGKWLLNKSDGRVRKDLVSTKKEEEVYAYYTRSEEYTSVALDDPDYKKKTLTSNQFKKAMRIYIKNNGIQNPKVKFRTARKKPKADVVVAQPENVEGTKAEISKFKDVKKPLMDWRVAFKMVEFGAMKLLGRQTVSPFGMVVWGNGGTGKSFIFKQLEAKHGSKEVYIIKADPSKKTVNKELYNARNAKIIVFDDADKVLKDAGLRNILKAATDDTVRETNGGPVFLPLTGFTAKEASKLPDIIMPTDDDGNVIESGVPKFQFNANVVIITNVDKVVEQALWTRLIKAPVFMTADEIVEKIYETGKNAIEAYGATPEQGREIADYMLYLIESDQYDINDEDVSYRIFKEGLFFITQAPMDWEGFLKIQFGFDIRTGLEKKKRTKNV